MKFFIYLITLSLLFASIGQVGTDLYLPSLPAMRGALHASTHLVQATVFIYMLGYSFSRLIFGPLSDAYGRKKPLMLGVLIFAAGAFVCLFANSINVLLVGRLIQGFGGGAGVVIAGTILRDQLNGDQLAQGFSFMTISNIVIVGTAPLIGGYLEHLFNWRASFVFLFIYGCAAFLVSFFFHETNKHQDKDHIKLWKIRANLADIFHNRDFLIYGVFIAMVYGGMVAWLTLGPILLHDRANISPVEFGWLAILPGIVYGIGALLNGVMVMRLDRNKLVLCGIIAVVISGVLMLLFTLMGIVNVVVVIIPVMFLMLGGSFIFPNAVAGALIPFGKIAGLAAAILGFLQIAGGAVTSGVIAILPDHSQMPLAVMFVLFGFSMLCLFFRLRGYSRAKA